MKRKTLVFFLMLVFILLFLSACGNNGTGEGIKEEAGKQISGSDIEVQSGEKATGKPETKDEEIRESAKEPENLEANDVGQKDQAVVPGEEKQGTQETIPDSGVTLWITRDFGKKTILNQKVPLEKEWSVFEVLHSSADITTAYGGSYVEGINGLKTTTGGLGGEKQDWFYYVNGVFCDVGALDYYPRSGDIVWWDYHRWQNMSTFPSVVGCYPRPFLSGFRGQTNSTVIMSSESHRDLAGKFKQALQSQGVASVSVKGLDPGLLEDRQNPVIVLGEWSELSEVEWLKGFNKAYTKNGTCIHFTAGAVELLDYKRQVVRTVSGDVGVITATGTGSGDPNPLWLVVGSSPKGLSQAVNVLVNSPGKIRGMYGAAIFEGEVIRLPLQ